MTERVQVVEHAVFGETMSNGLRLDVHDMALKVGRMWTLAQLVAQHLKIEVPPE
jgi:hypothetical protein